MKTSLLFSFLVLFLCLGSAHAQWSSLPTSNLAIAKGPASQVQPKIAPTGDGGCYISWFGGSGYDVYLQRLDAAGREQWVHGGVLVADRGFSSTQDYGLDVDLVGNALLAFRDDRFTGIQVTAAKVDQGGKLVWGTNGVQLTGTTSFVAAPKVAGTNDGCVVVAWTHGSTVQVQKLNPVGKPMWLAPVLLSHSTQSFSVSDMHDSDKGSVIISMVRSGSFISPRHLVAQKLNALGALQWGTAHVAVFDGGSLQMGNYPKFVSDGEGGAVFCWYASSPALECYAQRVNILGVEQFPHNGVSASLDTTKKRVNPAVSFDRATKSTFLVYREQSGSSSGVSAQRFDLTGKRQWTTNGVAITPLGTSDIGDLNCLSLQGGVMGFWTAAPAYGQDRIYGVRLDLAGKTVVSPFAISSTPAVKFRLNSALSKRGFAILAWRDEGAKNPDILAQNALPSGQLGGIATATSRNGINVNPSRYSTLTPPAIGSTWQTQVTHPTTASATAILLSAKAASGPVLPGFGEILISLPLSILSLKNAQGTAAIHALPIPLIHELVGAVVSTQALIVEGTKVQLCNALDIRFGL